MKKLFKYLVDLYWRKLKSPVKYAKHLGVNIGENNFIAIRDWSSEPYLITIGNNVAITSGVRIHTHGGARVARKKYPMFDMFGKVVIKDGAYIGTNSQILPGITIGEGSLIAAGSIVTKSVPDFEVWGGNPAKFICTVDNFIKKNMRYNLNTKGYGAKQKKEYLLSLNDDRFIKK